MAKHRTNGVPFREAEKAIIRRVWPDKGGVYTAELLLKELKSKRSRGSIDKHARNILHLSLNPETSPQRFAEGRARAQANAKAVKKSRTPALSSFAGYCSPEQVKSKPAQRIRGLMGVGCHG